MTYTLINATGKIDITSTADGDKHVVDYDAASADSGSYQYQQYFTKSGDRFTVETGFIEVLANFTDSATLDSRSHVKKTLDSIYAVIEKSASKDQLSYSIEGRSLSRRSYTELLELKDRYEQLWRAEQRSAAIANGQTAGGRVLYKMSGN